MSARPGGATPTLYRLETDFGPLFLVDKGMALARIDFTAIPVHAECRAGETALLREAVSQLHEYFAGTRMAFDLPLAPEGTAFQRGVWKALLDIPYGETRSYRQIAEAVGSPKACRAVGGANNKNPLSIVIPCHRVIGANGGLVGYGGGLDKKQQLLLLERENRSRFMTVDTEKKRSGSAE
jgi:methylated-DNA-[protein]-cysteine S-methyltransferase